MNEQPNCEESYVSLSAFLCLDYKKQREDIRLFPDLLVNVDSAVLKNPSTSEIHFEGISPSELDVRDQENTENKSAGKQKKEKKEYSKIYRKKQKDYIENLKMMNEKYEQKIEQLTLKIEQMTQQIRCLKYGKHISDNLFDSTFMKQKEQTLKELVNQATQKKQPTWEQLKEFNFVYGFAGKEKINLLNYYMSQIIDNLLIDQNKNFVMNGLNDFQIFTPYGKRLQEKELEILNFSNSDAVQLRKFLKKLMPQTLRKFHQSGQEFYQSYVKLIGAAKQIQNHFTRIEDGLFKLLSADQYLAVLKWYEENKHSRDIQLMRKEWFESFRKK